MRALGCNIRTLEGVTGQELLPLIDQGIRRIEADPADYQALVPASSTYDYRMALDFLHFLRDASRLAPKATVIFA